MYNNECAQETVAVTSILQTFDQVNKNKIQYIYIVDLPSMLLRYAHHSFLVWVSCFVNSIYMVLEFFAMCFLLCACQFGARYISCGWVCPLRIFLVPLDIIQVFVWGGRGGLVLADMYDGGILFKRDILWQQWKRISMEWPTFYETVTCCLLVYESN